MGGPNGYDLFFRRNPIMKKTLSVLLAAATTMSIGVTAFAQDLNVSDIINAPIDSALSQAGEEDASSSTPEDYSSSSSTPEDNSSSSSTPEDNSSSSTPEDNSSSSSTPEEKPEGDPSSFIFGADKENEGAVLGTTILEPGVEYKFPVSLGYGDKSFAMTDEMIKDFKFTYSKLSSNGVKTFEIKEYKGAYYLYIEVKETTPLKPVDVKYNVKLVRKSDNMAVFAQEVKFQYGFDEANGDYINGLDKGDAVEIDNNNPVITANQFDKIAKVNDYKNVTIQGPSWSFTVNVTDETTKNLVSNNAGIKEILSKLPDQEFKFFNFAGKPVFNSTGRVALDVDDIVDEFEKLYAYRYANGKLYRLNTTLNSEENTLEFRTNTLDTFVVTDKLIKDGFHVSDDVKGDTVENENNSSSGSQDDEGKKNPSTGASDVGSAVAAALASLAAAGFAIGKKRI